MSGEEKREREMSERVDRDSPLGALFTCWLIHRARSPGAALLTGCDIRRGSQRGTVSHSSTCLTLSHIISLSLQCSSQLLPKPLQIAGCYYSKLLIGLNYDEELL